MQHICFYWQSALWSGTMGDLKPTDFGAKNPPRMRKAFRTCGPPNCLISFRIRDLRGHRGHQVGQMHSLMEQHQAGMVALREKSSSAGVLQSRMLIKGHWLASFLLVPDSSGYNPSWQSWNGTITVEDHLPKTQHNYSSLWIQTLSEKVLKPPNYSKLYPKHFLRRYLDP